MATRARDPYSTPSPWYGLPKRGTLNLLTILNDGVLEVLAGIDLKVTLLVAQVCKQARACVLAWRGYITKTVPADRGYFEAHIQYGAKTRIVRVRRVRHGGCKMRGLPPSYTYETLQDGQLLGIEEVQRWQSHGEPEFPSAAPADEAAFWCVLRASPLVELTVTVFAGEPVDPKLLALVATPPRLKLANYEDPALMSHTDDVFADLLTLYDGFHVEAVHSNFSLHESVFDEDREPAKDDASPLKLILERFHDTIECISIFWDHFDAFDLEDDEDGDFPIRTDEGYERLEAVGDTISRLVCNGNLPRLNELRCYIGPLSLTKAALRALVPKCTKSLMLCDHLDTGNLLRALRASPPHPDGTGSLFCPELWKPKLLAEWARVYPKTSQLWFDVCEDHTFTNGIFRDIVGFQHADELLLPNLLWYRSSCKKLFLRRLRASAVKYVTIKELHVPAALLAEAQGAQAWLVQQLSDDYSIEIESVHPHAGEAERRRTA